MFGIKTGGAVPKIVNGALLGVGLTAGWIFTNYAASFLSQMASGARAFQGNVLPRDDYMQQAPYEAQYPYGPMDETRFSG